MLRLSGAEGAFSFMNGDYAYEGQHQGRSFWQLRSAAGELVRVCFLCSLQRQSPPYHGAFTVTYRVFGQEGYGTPG